VVIVLRVNRETTRKNQKEKKKKKAGKTAWE